MREKRREGEEKNGELEEEESEKRKWERVRKGRKIEAILRYFGLATHNEKILRVGRRSERREGDVGMIY